MSATASRPAIPMIKVQTTKFPEFGSLRNRNCSQPSSLGLTFNTTNNTWNSTNDIWAMHTLSSSILNTNREVPRTRVDEISDSTDDSCTSSALAVSSEDESWLDRQWNHLNSSSPTSHPQTDNIPSPNSRNASSHLKTQEKVNVQNSYRKTSRPRFVDGVGYSESPKNSFSKLDPSLRTFTFAGQTSISHETNKEETLSRPISEKSINMGYPKYIPARSTISRDYCQMMAGDSDKESTIDDSSLRQGTLAGQNKFSYGVLSENPSYLGLEPLLSSHADTSRFDISSTGSELGRRIGRESEETLPLQIQQPISCHSNHYTANPKFSFPNNKFSRSGNPLSTANNDSHSHRITINRSYNDIKISPTDKDVVLPGNFQNRRASSTAMYTPQIKPAALNRYKSESPRINRDSSCQERQTQNPYLTLAQDNIFGHHFHSQIPRHLHGLSRAIFRSHQPTLTFNHPVIVEPYHPSHIISTHAVTEHDVGVGFRSVLLEEFRKNTKYGKKYELKDLHHHIVEFSGDQHGSRFIQTKLGTANSDDKEQVFREIQPNALQLMTDVYGNYVIQKLFEHGNQVQKRVLAEQLKNHVMELSLQMYGCRVVQKALEYVLDDQQAKLIEELRVDVLKCVKDQNGNHVVQKAIERVSSQHVQFITDAFQGKAEALAVHPYGCRVIQRILEFSKPHDQVIILKELYECLEMLISDQYGNYVSQHLIRHGTPECRNKVIDVVIGQLLKFSKHKFASNVVEKSIIHGTEDQRRLMISKLVAMNIDGISSLQLLMKDQYGNYVIQKLAAELHGAEKVAFLNTIKVQLLQLKKYSYSKQIDVFEKFLFTHSQDSQSLMSKDVTRPNADSSFDFKISKFGHRTINEPTEINTSPIEKNLNCKAVIINH